MTWREYDQTMVLVVEKLDLAPFTPNDNAVVYRADGSERFRVCPPSDLMRDPKDVDGFYSAFPSQGRPLVIMATSGAISTAASTWRPGRSWTPTTGADASAADGEPHHSGTGHAPDWCAQARAGSKSITTIFSN